MKKYKLLKHWEEGQIPVGKTFEIPNRDYIKTDAYGDINAKFLIDNGYIEEVKEDKVEEFIQKICNDMCIDINGINGDILKGYIEDNGKEEIYGKINTIFIKNNDIEVEKFLKQLLDCLDNYIIIKI